MNQVGRIGWVDLTVPEAENVRQFYSAVTGWQSSPVDMGGYADFNMTSPASEQPVAGICHARGVNADLPAQWMIYIQVESLSESMERCVTLGGKLITGPKGFGGLGKYCVIQDTAGAIAALFEQAG